MSLPTITYANRAFDVYDGEDIHGARLVRLTKADLLEGTSYRHPHRGSGSGRIVIKRSHAARQYLVRGHYVRSVNLDTGEVDGGFFLDEGEEIVLSDKVTKAFTIGGPSTIAYYRRAHLDDTSRSPAGGPFDQEWIDTTGARRWTVTGETQGYDNIIRRLIVEAALLPTNPIPAVDPTGFWASVTAESTVVMTGTFESPYGLNLLDEIERARNAGGLDLYINPDTFATRITDFDALAVDRSGGAFGANVVRFEAGANIAADLKRAIHHSNYVSHLIVHNPDRTVSVVVADPDWSAGDPVRYGELVVDVDDVEESYLEEVGLKDIELRKLETDEPTFPFTYGDDEAIGKYTPMDRSGSGGHFAPGDWVTLHTGTDPGDFNEQKIQVAAVNWVIAANGLFVPWVELGAKYTSTLAAALDNRLGGVGRGCDCPKLCDPSLVLATSTAWKVYDGGTPPAGFHLVGYDDTLLANAVVQASSGSWYDPGSEQWIWETSGTIASGEERSFRREFSLTDVPSRAELVVSADNGCLVYINGTLVASLGAAQRGAANGWDWTKAKSVPVDPSLLVAGANCISIIGWNETNADPGPAGVYAVLTLGIGGTSQRAARCDHGHLLPDMPELTSAIPGISLPLTPFDEHDVPRGYNLTKQGVVIERGGVGSWKRALVESLHVSYHPPSRKYIGLFVGYSGAPGSADVGAIGMVSADSPYDIRPGGPFTEEASPIFEASGGVGDPDEAGVSGPSLWYEAGRTHLFYIGFTDVGYEGGTKTICHASTTDADLTTATWTRHGAIIEPSDLATMDTAIWHPNIVKRAGAYYLFFNANGSLEQIHVAMSTDLDTWTVHGEAIVTVGAGGSWNDAGLGDPYVYRIGETWFMDVFGNNGTNAQDGRYYTSDADFPFGWQEVDGNPILTIGSAGADDALHAHKPCIWIGTSVHLHWYTAVDDSTPEKREIALALEFAPGVGPGGAEELDDLSDVTLTSPAAADRIRHNGSVWVNTSLIWKPVMTYDGNNWLVAVDGDGNPIMSEA